MKVEGDTLWLHQSDIKHFMTCPEQFRVSNGFGPGVDLGDGLPRVETDAAVLGTTLHAVIEHDLGKPFDSTAQALKYGKKFHSDLTLGFLADGVEYRTESFGSDPKKVIRELEVLVGAWMTSDERHYWMSLVNEHPNAILIEYQFDVPFLQRPDKQYSQVRLSGTPDIIDTYGNRLVDWKTASRPYQRWEKQRWDVQSTVYTYAAAQLGLIKPHKQGYRFDFRVFTRGKNEDPQNLTVWRDTGQWGWLVQVVTNMVELMESDLEAWPLRDDHALCGPKWCPNWNNCKGSYVTEDWK